MAIREKFERIVDTNSTLTQRYSQYFHTFVPNERLRRIGGVVVALYHEGLVGRATGSDTEWAYVTQEDILLGTLTVKETITYSAQLRLPGNMTKDQVNEIVEGTIMEMGLQDCADQLIGNWHLRCISGGEKKRLGIALEILTRPSLLFLDEPTSGLDSASAFFVVQALRNVCCGGRTIISSIHQPSSEVFALFNDLFLLSGGETVYFGEAKKALEDDDDDFSEQDDDQNPPQSPTPTTPESTLLSSGTAIVVATGEFNRRFCEPITFVTGSATVVIIEDSVKIAVGMVDLVI
ncbi:hypothetical protein RJ639_024557 [Escallonia herrerae]|uniref:ABC transporter domain-containing protein n=1 Tax=Escallonia herrerae TaxID=1293975 RepID=A0AA88V0E1_9ASTE|nr:hypothetical protein RJ639_024557 [Escallonia herrerae]